MSEERKEGGQNGDKERDIERLKDVFIFLIIKCRSDGKLRYANNSHYKNETMIRKEGKFF